MQKAIVSFFVFFFTLKFAFSQVGFMGKVNELSFDLFDPLYQNYHNGIYKLSFHENYAFYFNAGINKSQGTFTSTDFLAHNYFIYDTIQSIKFDYSGFSWGFGFLWNKILINGIQNIAMPLGFYSGIGFEHHKGKLLQDYISNNYSKNVEYINTSYRFKSMIGTEAILFKNFTMDLCIEYGFALGNYYSDYNIYEFKPHNIYPFNIVFYHKKRNFETDFGTFSGDRWSYFQIYLSPKIRMGYLF